MVNARGYEKWEEGNEEPLPLEGKTVVSAKKGKDEKGYDYVTLLFSDGTVLRMEEQGQTGWFKTTVSKSPAAARQT